MNEEQNDYINILKDIFHFSNDNSSEIYPILKDSDNIKKFKEYIKNKNTINKNKILLLQKLKIIFEQNDVLIPFFINNCYKKPYYFFYPIINLYLAEDIDEDSMNFLEEFLFLINTHISLNKQILEFIYQKLSKFFGNRSKINLTELQFIRYLRLLKIFYKDTSTNENISVSENKNSITDEKKSKKIKNYMFFNGFNSCLTFSEKKNPTNGNISFPTLENGVSIIFWFYFDKKLLNNYYKIYQNIEINLITITIDKNIIKLRFEESRYLIIKINDEESKKIDIFTFLKENEWNFMSFVINYKDKKLNRIYINNASMEYNLIINKTFPVTQKIDTIKLFQNYIGKITSILFFSFPLDQKIVNQFVSQLKYLSYGFYSNRILFRFLYAHDNNYFKNSINYNYLVKYQNEKLSEKFLKLESTDKTKNNIITLFCPFAYIKESNQLDDIFGNYIGNLSKNDGVIVYIKYTKNIMQMGDLNSLLPISELMYSSLQGTPNPSYTQVEKGLLSEKTFFEYLNIIKTILYHHSQNINYLNSNNFFGNLSLFLERYPSEIFTEKILDILIDIGIEILKYNPDNTKPNNEHYITCILLNEKIFSKFNGENQNELWKHLYQFFTPNYNRLGFYLNIKKICHLIRFYDQKRYEEYCCSNHASLFSKTTNEKDKNIIIKKNMKIMEPEINVKLEYFFNTIQLYFDKIIKYNQNYNINNINSIDSTKEINLYQLLSLDLSPCIQKKIIQVYINHFQASSQNVSENNKIDTLNNLLYNNYIEVTEYVLSISLLDTRTLLLSLFRIILSNYFNIFISFYMKMNSDNSNKLQNIILFLGDNLFPDKLFLNIDYNISKDDYKIYENSFLKTEKNDKNLIKKRSNSLTKKNNKLEEKIKFIFDRYLSKINLINYFNKEVYQKEVESFNLSLINFVDKLCNETKEINPFIIYMLTTFSKKLSVGYIEMLSYYLFSNFQDKNPLNTETKTKNKKRKTIKKNSIKENENNNINDKLMLSEKEIIYQWLIDTIFFFNNSENLKNFSKDDNELILKIQTSTLELLKIYFYGKKTQKEINSRIKYLFDYLYNMKNCYKNKKEKLKELVKVARNLIRIILEFSDEDISMKAIISFEFIFLFQNSEKLLNINYRKNNDSIENILYGSMNINDSNLKNEHNNKTQENIIINQNNESNKNIINNEIKLLNEDETPNELESKNNPKKVKEILDPKDFIPNYILEGLYFTEISEVENGNEINTEIKEEKQSEKIWSDFLISNYIIDNYQLNFWGTGHICEKVKLPTDSYWIDISNLLLEKYGYKSYKKNQNILMEDILKLLNWPNEKSEESDIENNRDSKKSRDSKEIKRNSSNDIKFDISKKHQSSINILNINLILLTITTLLKINGEEKDFYIGQYQIFLLFCILASINLSSSAKNYEQIQNILYNILGYGFSFLRVISEDKYNELIKYMIIPIIDEINNDFFKIKFKTIFGIQNKLLYRNTAIFKLFVNIIFDGSEKPKEKEKGKGKEKETETDKEKEIEIKKEEENMEDKMEIINKKVSKVIKANNNKTKVYLDFHEVDINKLINEIFNITLEKYKIYRENNTTPNIIKYYEDDEHNNINYTKLLEEKNKMTKIIKELIPFVESQIKDNSDLSRYKEKKRKINYKKLKAKLFSWRSFWSDRNLFFKHPEHIKVKIKNFFTNEMFKPLLSPILDIKYYLPDFSQFDKSNLFNNENYKYYINLNINEILGIKNAEEQHHKNDHNKILVNSKNNHKFNYLKSLYKYNYEGIGDLYDDKKEELPFSSLEKQELDIISNYIKKGIKIKNNTNDNKNIIKEIPRGSIKSENQMISKEIKYMNCCLIKSSHHIKGKIIAEKNYFIFFPINNKYKTEKMLKQENANNPNFDKISGCCYGAYFKHFSKDKDAVELVLKYSKIKYIFIRVYYYNESALEIYTFSNKNYYINFLSKKDMNELLTTIISNNTDFNPIKTDNKRILGYIQMKNLKDKKKSYHILNKSEDWQNYRISTFEYLMWLNIYAGRSFNDITQYPVFPWILTDYESNDLSKIKRDFSLPIGMFTIDKWEQSTKRKEGYLEIFENSLNVFENNNPHFNMKTYLEKGDEYFHSFNNKILKMKSKEDKKNNESKGDVDYDEDDDEYNEIQINQIPYIYGSHYSNPLYISHFLVRIFPFSFISIQIHGAKFDDPGRLFFSLSKTFQCVCTLKEDLRELIPEFYSFPEIFLNHNKLKLAPNTICLDGEFFNINDVILPPWSENNPSIFVSKMRSFMENNSENINKWIDLIFGYNQRGENAQSNNNLFMAQTYEKMVKIDEVTDSSFRETLMRLIEIGVTPFKLFFNESKDRINKNEFIKKSPIYCCSKGTFLDMFKKLDALSLFSDIYKSLCEKLDLSINKDGSESSIKILSIKSINNMAKSSIIIFTSSNHWYEIKYNISKAEIIKEEKQIRIIKNNSSKYSSSYVMSHLKNIPFVVYGNCKYILKGGFWDGRIEFNSINMTQNNKYISKCIFSNYSQPIIVMKISSDEKYLFCGTNSGLIIIYKVSSPDIKLKKYVVHHSDEITDISVNSLLNLFASVSKDGYLFLYILPSFKMVRAIKISNNNKNRLAINLENEINNSLNKNDNQNKEKVNNIEEKIDTEKEETKEDNIDLIKKKEIKIEDNDKEKNNINPEKANDEEEQEDEEEEENSEQIYADNVFISSSPLPCITIYISKIKLFRTYTINGEFVSEQKEEDELGSIYIKNPKIFKNITLEDFLIYGTDKGYVKIRRFPDMKLIGEKFDVTHGIPIETLEISEDKRFCFVWSKGNLINIIKDIGVSTVQTAENISGMGFHI